MSAIHPTAIIGKGVTLGKDVAVGPYCVVEGDITIGDGTQTVTFNTTAGAVETVGDLITAINGNSALKVTASLNNDGELVLAADDNTVGISIAYGGAATAGTSGFAAQAATAPAVVNTAVAKSVDQLVSEINDKSGSNTGG